MVEAIREPERALVVTAHPDDVDFAAGGTVAQLVRAGTEVAYVIATDGQTGGFDASIPRGEMSGLRRAEQHAAAAVLGVEDLTFLGFVDGELQVTLELRREIARHIRRLRPEVVLTASPQRDLARVAGQGHPDHLAVGEATLCAVYPDARNPFAFPELLERDGLEPHAVPQVWLFSGPDPDLTVDVTDTIDAKLAAIACHVTQLPDPAAAEERVRTMLRTRAEAAGLPTGRYAERFRVVSTA